MASIEKAAINAGLLPSQLWDMTLGEILLVLEVWGEQIVIDTDMANYRVGLICSVLANLQRDSKKKREPWLPSDFIYLSTVKKKEKQPMTDEEMLETVKQANVVLDGEVK